MNHERPLAPLLLVLSLAPMAPLGAAQTATKNSAVAVRPTIPGEVWVANRGNDSVAVVDTTAGVTVAEIDVDVWPRSVAFTPDGATAFVANQRGNVEVTKNFVTPFSGAERRGTISVIDAASRTVTATLEDVGTEPYGLAVAPNGLWFAVTGFRSGTVKFYSTAAPYPLLTSFQYDRDLNFVPAGKTVTDLDENRDFVADLDEPRALTISAGGARVFVTHSLPGFVSALDLTLDVSGRPTSAALAGKIDLDTYGPDTFFDPSVVQAIKSQGIPRFLDDIALSPDETRALVPHVLHNTNHDVNHDFGPGLAGDFANRVYPALTQIDADDLSYGAGGDASRRLHHELAEPLVPAQHVPFGGQGALRGTDVLTLGGTGTPVLGGSGDYVLAGVAPGDVSFLYYSFSAAALPAPPFGTVLLGRPLFRMAVAGTTASLAIPNDPGLEGRSAFLQGLVLDGQSGLIAGLTNGVETVVGAAGFGTNQLGHRAGHPGRVLFNADGDHAILLNRGSEDLFLYRVTGDDLTLRTVFPPRHGHVERAALDATTPMGDLPLGMALAADPSTSNRDALLYVVNETSRTLSSLRIDFDAGTIAQEAPQISTVLGPDLMTLSERRGQELFEDASRAQTAGNFNNSCHSCHFEGGADGNVWQRPAGPRSTMPVYGGSQLTGLILWKGVRLNLGETGPMFTGENGGTGSFDDAEQQALIDYHAIIPTPLNPHLDPFTGAYSANAAFGKDLYFGTNDTGLNPLLRNAGCVTCHPDEDPSSTTVRAYTTDFLDPVITSTPGGLETFDPLCFSLQQNLIQGLNVRNVNSGVNVDVDGDGFPDPDRNADGISDIESYAPMNVDTKDDFARDDGNGYPCYVTPGDPSSGQKIFLRDEVDFVVPTKLGVFSTGPYFHDHAVSSLRVLLDPSLQTSDPVYGDPSYPGLNKFLNEFHDLRGDGSVVPNSSKVQVTLQTATAGSTVEADLEALLEYIASL